VICAIFFVSILPPVGGLSSPATTATQRFSALTDGLDWHASADEIDNPVTKLRGALILARWGAEAAHHECI
jgi:hypothetical protein